MVQHWSFNWETLCFLVSSSTSGRYSRGKDAWKIGKVVAIFSAFWGPPRPNHQFSEQPNVLKVCIKGEIVPFFLEQLFHYHRNCWVCQYEVVFVPRVRGTPSLLSIVVKTKPRILETHFDLGRFLVEGFLAAMAAMPCEVKVKTLEGGVLTVEIMPTNTIEELKAWLYEKKHCEDPIERKILKVKVLANGLLVDDDQTVESAELLHTESEVTVVYCRNEVEAATKETIHAEGFLQVTIPFSLTEIPAWAFHGCHQVVKVAIPESVTAIGESAFRRCEYLESITIPTSVTAIGAGAFAKCNSLANIVIPDSVTAIGESAFAHCTSLKTITIPESVTAIEDRAFVRCRSLASIVIPESVVAIGDFAFAQCKSLASIAIPQSVTAIGVSAFVHCRLASINIPQSVRSIRVGAFQHCRSLESIVIPESVICHWEWCLWRLQIFGEHHYP